MSDHQDEKAIIEGLEARAILLEREAREKDGRAETARFNAMNLRNRAGRLEHLEQDARTNPEAAPCLFPVLEECRRLPSELVSLAGLLSEYGAGHLVDRVLERKWCEVAEIARRVADGLKLTEPAPLPAARYIALVEDTAQILEKAAEVMASPGSDPEGSRVE